MSGKIRAVVLAAGRSSRMGARNKLLEPIAGKPMIALVAETALRSGAAPVIVVTGFDATRVAAALSGLGVNIVHNAAFDEGLSSSLKAGLSTLPPDCDGALILLGDMPAIDASVLGALTAAFSGRDAICVPVHQGRRGNPVLWGRSYFAEMTQLTGDFGAKTLMTLHADRVTEVEVGSESIFADIDTPADLARLTADARTRRSR